MISLKINDEKHRDVVISLSRENRLMISAGNGIIEGLDRPKKNSRWSSILSRARSYTPEGITVTRTVAKSNPFYLV